MNNDNAGNNVIEVSVLEHKLRVVRGDSVMREFPVAVGKYNDRPKLWGWDYRTPIGEYHVRKIFQRGSRELMDLNRKHYSWYLAHKAKNPHEDAGAGIYGDGLIELSYPSHEDVHRYLDANKPDDERNRELEKVWEEFCKTHWRPVYEYFVSHNGEDFDKVRVPGDFGSMTYQQLLKEISVHDFQKAFKGIVAIHGTNDPDCIGMNISDGCIRMHNQDIEELIRRYVKIDTLVKIS